MEGVACKRRDERALWASVGVVAGQTDTAEHTNTADLGQQKRVPASGGGVSSAYPLSAGTGLGFARRRALAPGPALPHSVDPCAWPWYLRLFARMCVVDNVSAFDDVSHTL